MSFAQKKEMDPIIKVFTFVLMMLGVLANNIFVRGFVCVIILCAVTIEWYRLETENQQYRMHCVV